MFMSTRYVYTHVLAEHLSLFAPQIVQFNSPRHAYSCLPCLLRRSVLSTQSLRTSETAAMTTATLCSLLDTASETLGTWKLTLGRELRSCVSKPYASEIRAKRTQRPDLSGDVLELADALGNSVCYATCQWGVYGVVARPIDIPPCSSFYYSN
jgi:hypothetical protein